MNPAAYRVLLAGSLLLASCGSTSPKPGDVTNAVIDCTSTVCDGNRAEQCTQLVSIAITCLASQGNVAACMAGIPALVQVGYADVVCVVDMLDLKPLPEAKANADTWMRSQRVTIARRAK